MLILKLAYNEELTFSHDLQELKESLKKKDITIGLVESIEGKTHIIKIMCDKDSYNNKIEEIINLYVSNILYRIVIDYYRKREMFEFITDNYFFLKQSEILEVENKILKVLNCEAACKDEDSIYCLNRINNIIEKIRQCIGEKQEINVDGFITFRLRMLREDIEKIVDKVVEKYMVEKEYEEFVRLLKYFVDIQECKIEKIIISIEAGSHYIIKDEYGKDLYKDFLKELTSDENDFDINIEDILISGLITSSPKNIIIYGKRNCNNKEFLETIKNVFGDRVTCFDECIEYLPKKILSKNVDMF
ncbi:MULTISPECIES: putative sporulation protein YtxC [Clostridium]|uniref:putative sporulation protein YtxC n=1 Tax=Clostridium TaxID=1485 RepID=UPI0008A41E28|nr:MULTISPECIES: putative sporulation protein YtxC [Clostridium]MDU1231399.1 putative sporulation protein YtxC [Clostridium sp.]OFS20618.1 sporulation protein [Clostridium sp. HMSC19A10]